MDNGLILQICTAIFFFISLLFAFFLISVESTNKKGNLILACFLVLRAFDSSILIWGNYIKLHPVLDMLRHDIGGFFQAPLLFLFVLSILYADFQLKVKYLLFLIPFLLSVLVSLPAYYLPHFGIKLSIFDGLAPDFEWLFTYTLASLQNAFFIIATFWVLERYRKLLLENHSISDHRTHRWLMQLNVINTLIFFTALIKNIHKFEAHPIFIVQLRIVVILVLLGFACWLLLTALHAPKLFRGIDSNLQLYAEYKSEVPLPVETNSTYIPKEISKLRLYMEEKKPFLNPQLTITDLANQLEINVRELSHIMNHHIGQDFYNFINEYRINTAKLLLMEQGAAKLSVKEILYKVGFSSKSSFNVSFKKATGLTPTQFRTKHSKPTP